jgi:tRNA-splicing ligase RtcB
MAYKELLQKIGEYEWLLPKTSREKMNVAGKLLGNKHIYDLMEDETIGQLANVCTMPGVIEPVVALPDAHLGYGLPMGSVAAFDSEKGIISSGLCGFDINCGINLIRTNLTKDELKKKSKELVAELYENVPVGVGGKGRLRLNPNELDDVLKHGLKWAVEKSYGTEEDIKHTEENGCMPDADPSKVSDLAKKRGGPQLGTLGSGNHFLEIQAVEEIFDQVAALKWGVKEKGQVLIMLHCGSRGLGHQVASDYLKSQEEAVKKYKIYIPDQQLACAPANSKEGQDFFAAMKCAVNYSFVNRLVMTQWIRETFEKIFQRDWESMDMKTIYGICHNVIKFEKHTVNGEKRELYVHRKGATRAFPDEPVIIAGSMGTSSYLCKGTEKAMQLTFGSSAHGAGRAMSRNEALRQFRGAQIQKELVSHGIESKAPSYESLAEEAPLAYKDVDQVIESVHQAGISLKVAKMVPLGVIKG